MFKVWSDLKNNTKKKAARLHRAASGTGGGPAVYTKLTDLEQRILNLIGHQVATGLALEEAGLYPPNLAVSLYRAETDGVFAKINELNGLREAMLAMFDDEIPRDRALQLEHAEKLIKTLYDYND
ncbi:hypothetical protein ACJJTC_018845 [Scirpophaga incertulas]